MSKMFVRDRFRMLFLMVASLIAMSGNTLWAHPLATDHVHVSGFEAGVTHPFAGLDHLLAMVMVGVLGMMVGGHSRWLFPGAFLGGMTAGGIMGISVRWSIPVEMGIALSVVLLGAAVWQNWKLNTALCLATLALFGAFHGYAHGVEIPGASSPVMYSVGFLLGSAGLHLAGMALSATAKHTEWGRGILRSSGAAVAATGLLMLSQV